METAAAGNLERWLLETLVGMRVTVALGSRTPRRIQDLRGNDEGAARRIQDLRGNDEEAAQERRVM